MNIPVTDTARGTGVVRATAWASAEALDMDHVIDMAQERKARLAGSRVKVSVAMVIVAGLGRIPLIALGVVPAWTWDAAHVKAAVPVWAWVAAHVRAMDPAWVWDAVHVKAAVPAWAWDVAHVKAAVPAWVWDEAHVKAMGLAWDMGDIGVMDRATVADLCMALAVILQKNDAAASWVTRCL